MSGLDGLDGLDEDSAPLITAPTVAICIAHAAWGERRMGGLMRLCANLGGPYHVSRSETKEHASVWARRLWELGARQEESHVVFLNDDIEVCPRFREAVTAMVAARPDEVISLHTSVPETEFRVLDGAWLTSYWLTGPGYVIPRALLLDLLAFAAEWAHLAANTNEDNLIMQWSWQRQRPIWQAVPALVRHDTTIPSTLGYDSHPLRQSNVSYADQTPEVLAAILTPEYWESEGAPLVECPWMSVSQLQNIALKFAPQPPQPPRKAMAEWAVRQRFYRRMADRESPPDASLFVALATSGEIHGQCVRSVWRLLRDPHLLAADLEVGDLQIWTKDIIRVRNRIVDIFLNETDASHLLFLDDDQEFDPIVIRGMLAAGLPMVAAPYPRREGVNWATVHESAIDDSPSPLEAAAYRYSYHPLPGDLNVDQATQCAEVMHMPFGCVLLERAALEGFALNFPQRYLDKRPTGERSVVPNLFGTVVKEYATHGEDSGLLSEDYSFCFNWRAAGNRVYMYLGEGAPINHVGNHVYRGHIEAFGLKRIPK